MNNKLKILLTAEFYYPSVGGAQEVVRQLGEKLLELGHDVTVATTRMTERVSRIINGVKIKEFNISGNQVRGYTGEIDKYKKFLVESNYDVIMNYAAQQWTADLLFEVIHDIKAKKVLVPCGFSGLFDSSYKDYFCQMPKTLKNYDATIYLSNDYRDINFAKKHKVRSTYLIPNGADEKEFNNSVNVNLYKILNIPKNYSLVLHVGRFSGLKGQLEAMKIFDKSKIKNSCLLLVGDKENSIYKSYLRYAKFLNIKNLFKKKKIVCKIFDRKLTIASYQQANLFLFPSNIECSPIVLFEAMASKTPFMSTDVGNAKEIAKWSQSGVVMPTEKLPNGLVRAKIKKSSELLTKIVNNKKRLKLMSEKGYKAWKIRFTWREIAKQYEKLFLSLTKHS